MDGRARETWMSRSVRHGRAPGAAPMLAAPEVAPPAPGDARLCVRSGHADLPSACSCCCRSSLPPWWRLSRLPTLCPSSWRGRRLQDRYEAFRSRPERTRARLLTVRRSGDHHPAAGAACLGTSALSRIGARPRREPAGTNVSRLWGQRRSDALPAREGPCPWHPLRARHQRPRQGDEHLAARAQVGARGRRCPVRGERPPHVREHDRQPQRLSDRLDPETGRVLWQSPSLVANADGFAVVGDVIVTGYGFTAEPDYLYALDRQNGPRARPAVAAHGAGADHREGHAPERPDVRPPGRRQATSRLVALPAPPSADRPPARRACAARG